MVVNSMSRSSITVLVRYVLISSMVGLPNQMLMSHYFPSEGHCWTVYDMSDRVRYLRLLGAPTLRWQRTPVGWVFFTGCGRGVEFSTFCWWFLIVSVALGSIVVWKQRMS